MTGGAQIGALAFGAVTNLLYARLLEPKEIGHLAVIVALALGAVVIADGGLQLFLTRAVSRGELDIDRAAGALLTALPANVVLVCAAVAVGDLLVGGRLETTLLIVEVAFSVATFQVALTLYQALNWFGGRAWLLLGNGAATAVATLAAVLIGPSTASAVHATALGYAVVGLTGILTVCVRFGCAPVGPRVLRSWYRGARGLWLNGILGFAMSSTDVLVAATVLPIAVVGYYQVLKKFAQILLSPFAAVLPLVYAHLSAVDRAARSRFVRRLALTSGAAAALGLLIASLGLRQGVGALAGHRYEGHVSILLALVAIGMAQFAHNLLGYVCSADGVFFRPLWINLTVALGAVGASVGLAYSFGVRGFLLGLALANAAGLVLGLRFTRPLLDSQAGRAVAAGVTLTGLAAAVSYALLDVATWPRVAAVSGGLIVLAACYWALTHARWMVGDVEMTAVGGTS